MVSYLFPVLTLTHKEIEILDTPPRLIVIVGPCRAGTTALANVFTKVGITTYMQPIKSARRAKEAGEEIVPWSIALEAVAVTKETLGPETEAEFFDPVEMLLGLGYPKDKLQLIAIVRDPGKTLASWRAMWGALNLERFVRSYELAREITQSAERRGITVVPYVHEAIRENESAFVVQRLFKKLGLDKNVSSNVVDWRGSPRFGEEDPGASRLRFYDVPPERFIREVKEWGGYQYHEEPGLRLSREDALFLREHPRVQEIYEEFRQGCERALGLKIARV